MIKKNIVFDLDDTLVVRGWDNLRDIPREELDYKEYPIKIRPHLRELLQELSQNHNLYIWTSVSKDGAIKTMSSVGLSQYFKNFYGQENMLNKMKLLRAVSGFSPANTLLIEDTYINVDGQSKNVIVIPPYITIPKQFIIREDKTLKDLKEFLLELLDKDNIATELGLLGAGKKSVFGEERPEPYYLTMSGMTIYDKQAFWLSKKEGKKDTSKTKQVTLDFSGVHLEEEEKTEEKVPSVVSNTSPPKLVEETKNKISSVSFSKKYFINIMGGHGTGKSTTVGALAKALGIQFSGTYENSNGKVAILGKYSPSKTTVGVFTGGMDMGFEDQKERFDLIQKYWFKEDIDVIICEGMIINYFATFWARYPELNKTLKRTLIPVVLKTDFDTILSRVDKRSNGREMNESRLENLKSKAKTPFRTLEKFEERFTQEDYVRLDFDTTVFGTNEIVTKVLETIGIKTENLGVTATELNTRQKIIKILETQEESYPIEDIIAKTSLSEEDTQEAIESLLKQGEIFETSPSKYRLLR